MSATIETNKAGSGKDPKAGSTQDTTGAVGSEAKPKREPSRQGGNVRLRSRFSNYRVGPGGKHKFEGNICVVTMAEFNSLKGMSEFGQGLDFWEDTEPDAPAAE